MSFCCKDCIHFVPHYRRNGRRFSRLPCGHCTTPRIKPRQDSTRACPHFSLLPPQKARKER